jgi:hypothetical protein
MRGDGGGGMRLRGLSQKVQLYTWSPNKLLTSNSIFNLWVNSRGYGNLQATYSIFCLLVREVFSYRFWPMSKFMICCNRFFVFLDSEYAEGEVEYMYDSNTAETGKNKPSSLCWICFRLALTAIVFMYRSVPLCTLQFLFIFNKFCDLSWSR